MCMICMNYFDPFAPKILLVTLLTDCQTVLVILVWIIWFWINLMIPHLVAFLCFHHLFTCYCIEIVGRNSVLVTHVS